MRAVAAGADFQNFHCLLLLLLAHGPEFDENQSDCWENKDKWHIEDNFVL